MTQGESRPTREDWQWAVIALAIPFLLCARQLRLDLWYDEVYTLLHFASRPVAQIVTDYSAPNNHIFYTLLLRPVYLLSSEPFVLRLSSLAITAATLLALFHLTRTLIDLTAAVAAVLLLGLNVMFLSHTMQLRGYGLSMLLVTLLADLAATYSTNRFRPFAIALIGAAFLYTIPTNLLFLLPLASWSITRKYRAGVRGTLLLRKALPWLAGCLMGGLGYLPVLDQLRSHQSAARASLAQIARMFGDVYWAAGHDVWPLFVVLLAIIALRRTWRDDPNWNVHSVVGLVFAMLVGPFLLAAVLGMTPFVRNFCPLLPFLALGIAWLVTVATRGRQVTLRPSVLQPVLATLLVALVLVPAALLYPARLTAYRRDHAAQDGYFSYYAADFEPSCVAQFLTHEIKPDENYAIAVSQADHYNLIYYLAEAGLPIRPVDVAVSNRSPRGYLYVVLPDNGELARASLAEIAEGVAIPLRELEKFTPIETCGYYRILRSPQPRLLSR